MTRQASTIADDLDRLGYFATALVAATDRVRASRPHSKPPDTR